MKQKPSPPNGKSAEEIRYQNIILEDMRSQIQTIAEGQISLRIELNTKIDHLDQRLTPEIKFTQQVLKTINDNLTGEIQNLRVDVQRVDNSLNRVETKLSADIQRVEKKLTAEIQRVELTLSKKIDRQGEKVERHDQEIITLKAAAAAL
ncbi:MAG: hypothetical protein A3I05_06020 [Deltaproteobacteria bacterium RIFCSPLOWO2_02_FULL_44_10]|nr:MAG: hypothetical protein A3C46_04835 [Deltaproteobacteria bacterium RIFCSPHIGHO2_02_FULL_44_16]OGQ46158.1 MAG: hypothetical protein A3I05_06020 [Deltaproteobacteria bacterium RIFCSPLOWO2_02_FULL_44_10]